MAPGEANNRIASGAALHVTVPPLRVGAPFATTLVDRRRAGSTR